ncbi:MULTISPECIES: GNAT family N-acetyltransferase [Halocynthiibacter]|uniref:GNAT family N-acetyltransferase n=1 Tax=Halocynthiibacter halioticoli TaxID=2986804 RepID=A0AAE3J318_9RHOB|nr:MULTISPECIES: GNAT family N-acetyltransferase [Halocynthiibacter]MCV6825451.1 GNAT family N-acetyltransferase [Halocynthiibacter halioticoli]MCW4058452.1 GNAT family N-acetyltransferase [Halocynthiibacter sp. SDUM655004]
MTVELINSPVLETERLTLRLPRLEDLDIVTEFINSDRSRFVRPAEVDKGMPFRVLSMFVGMWALRGYGLFALCPKGSDKMIGAVGPWHPTHWPEPELGWSIYDPAYEGKGLAREAALATRDYAFDVLGWETAVSYIHKDNVASIKLAEALGCTLDPEADNMDDDNTLVYRHPAPSSDDDDGSQEAYA